MSAGPLDYVTYKYVVLKDRRLGVAYYILAISIVLFIITEVFYRKGYLQVGDVIMLISYKIRISKTYFD